MPAKVNDRKERLREQSRKVGYLDPVSGGLPEPG